MLSEQEQELGLVREAELLARGANIDLVLQIRTHLGELPPERFEMLKRALTVQVPVISTGAKLQWAETARFFIAARMRQFSKQLSPLPSDGVVTKVILPSQRGV
jgi:hypothetical protein